MVRRTAQASQKRRRRFDYDAAASEIPGFLGKGKSAKQQRVDDRKDNAADLRRAYAAVDDRDKLCSVITGAQLTKGHRDDAQRVERHHMRRRAHDRTRIADPTNIITVSAQEADALDFHQLRPVNAEGDEVFHVDQIHHFAWNADILTKGTAPFPVPESPLGRYWVCRVL